MRRRALALLLLTLAAVPLGAQKGHSSSRGSGATRSSTRVRASEPRTVHVPRSTERRSTLAPRTRSAAPAKPRASRSSAGVPRSANGRIKRSAKAKDEFMRSTGHPKGWPGHVVDHRIPLACGGSDSPSNMQWQTVQAAKAKDKVETVGC